MYRNKYGGLSNGDKTEGAKMNQVNARHEIIREWRSLPRELRQTDEQAAAFAMQIKDKYKFSSDSADHYQTVKDWLLRYLSITRGLEPNAEDEGRMKGDAKSTDPGLSATERKTLRSREAKEAIAKHESAQKAFQNRERLRGNVSGGRKRQGRCSIRPPSFRTTPPSRTSDLLPGSGMHSMSGA